MADFSGGQRTTIETDVIHSSPESLAHALMMPMGLWIGIRGLRTMRNPLTALLFSYAERCPIGLQCQMGTPTAMEVEDMFKFALEHKASWIEFWHHDMIRDDYLPFFRRYQPRFLTRQE